MESKSGGVAGRSHVRGSASIAGLPTRADSSKSFTSHKRYSSASAASSSRTYGPTVSSLPTLASQSLLPPASLSAYRRSYTPASSSSRALQEQALAVTDESQGYKGLDEGIEEDDFMHNPDEKGGLRGGDGRGSILTTRGLVNIGCLFILLILLLGLFAVYPIAYTLTRDTWSTNGAYNIGGINSTGQIPQFNSFVSVVDKDTPKSAYTRKGFDGENYNLVYSDEFNEEGRTFYPGDDPYWTAVDLHYWGTGDFEWYDPSAITTRDGNLVITMSQEPIHGLNLKSGMLQSWNQLCFQYSAYIEVRVSLPGTPDVSGFWPAVWTMGNLGRPGYGATTDGTWPYTYDSCDIGTLKNQTNVAGTGPEAALESDQGRALSYLPGQKLSACTCKGEDHPGPDHTYGRGAPEIDIIEAEVNVTAGRGEVSQSAQIAPFDADYYIFNSSSDYTIYDRTKAQVNSYRGGPYQQAVSVQADVPRANYELTQKEFTTFGFEYWADPKNRDKGYINWVAAGEQSWTLRASAIRANPLTQVSQRLISEEPMAMIINLGAASNFQNVDWAHLSFPAEMLVDYIRVYQRPEGRLGCDPSDRPTADYIARHSDAYNNPNLTTWTAAGNTFPKNRLIDGCSQ